jgi:hypothetical protein
MLHTLITGVTILTVLSGDALAGTIGEHHEIRVTDASVIEWLSDDDSCETKEAEFQCLNHGDAYTITAKMTKDCTGKHVYIQATAVKKSVSIHSRLHPPTDSVPAEGIFGEGDGTETAAGASGFVLTKRMAAQDCPTPGECSLDTAAVCPLLDVAEVLNSDLVVILRGD